MKKLRSNRVNKNDKFDSGSTKRFGYEWSKYHEIIPEYEGQFLKWVFPLKKKDFIGKKILDAGCGTGRNSFWPLTYGAKEVFAFDYSRETVKVAKKNLSKFKNVKVSFNSIYDLDIKNKFDIVLSIGVIHHLEKPHLAIQRLVDSVKKNGVVLIWVYGYEGNEWIVDYINPIRRITSKLPLRVTNLISSFFSIILYCYLKIFSQKHIYLKQLSKFRFWHIHSIIFDQLIPKIANYWKKEEVLKLFEGKNLKNINIYKVNNNSWTIIGVKK